VHQWWVFLETGAIMLCVQQFIGHLDSEAQGALLISKESFLTFLREQFTTQDDLAAQARRDLEHAAKLMASGQRIHVEAMPDEREAAKAVLYAVMRLADRLKGTPQPTTPPPHSATDASRPKCWRTGYGGAGGWVTSSDFYPRFPFWISFSSNGRETLRFNVRTDQLESTLEDVQFGRGRSRRYVAALATVLATGLEQPLSWCVSHSRVQPLARRMLMAARKLLKGCGKISAPPVIDPTPKLEASTVDLLPMVDARPEVIGIGKTAHFDANVQRTGWARVSIDGEEVARVRCWLTDEVVPSRRKGLRRVQGGTIHQVEKPCGTPTLDFDEVRVIELGDRERLYGFGAPSSEIWLRGTADPEVMQLRLRQLLSQVAA
jgi:hypothetical protein